MKSKFNVALIAMVLGITTAFAFKAPERSKITQLYSYNSTLGQWNQTAIDPAKEGQPQGWQCTGVSNVCTGYFSSTPALHAAPPSGYEPGVFSVIP
jgi:hypothetical protein